MSWFTAFEIWGWYLIAAILGGIIGWVLHHLIRSRAERSKTVVKEVKDLSRYTPEELEAELNKRRGGKKVVSTTRDASRDKVRSIATRTSRGEPQVKDDLEEVYGIGPHIAGLLHDLGITSFAQIARFEHNDIEVVSDALETFPDRIVRDDWMSSARKLHIAKYGNDPLKEKV